MRLKIFVIGFIFGVQLNCFSQTQTIDWQENQYDGADKLFYIGGFTSVSTEFADIDSDNDNDCFLGTHEGNILFIENKGDSINPKWEIISKNYLDINLITIDRLKVELVDIDGDEDLDMFIGGSLNKGLYYYKNIGSKYSPEWEYNNSLLNDLESSATIKFCYPAFADIDNDGDFDLIYGNYKGYDIFYENIGTPENPSFSLKNEAYFGLSRFWNIHKIDLSDIDNDNDLDALVGTTYGLLLMKNIGSINSAVWSKDTSTYLGINRYYGTDYCPNFADLNGDNLNEIYIGTENGQIYTYKEIDSCWSKYNQLSFNEGYNTNLTFADIDGDSLVEMIIRKYNEYQDSSVLIVYKNVGDLDSIIWEYSSIEINITFPYPFNQVTFADIDNDNDLDLIAGFRYDAKEILLFENIGDKNNPQFGDIYQTIGNFQEDELFDFYPLLIDYDNDSDLDLIVSAQNGTMNSYGYVDFFENTGNITNPQWEYSSSKILGWGSIDAIDDDGDGDLDLMMGMFNQLSIISNKGTIYNPKFYPGHVNGIFDIDNSISGFSLVDLNNDGKKDLIAGTYAGGLLRFDNNGLKVGKDDGYIDGIQNNSLQLINIYPNPTDSYIEISGLNFAIFNYTIDIYNNLGKLLLSEKLNTNRFLIPDLSSGTYIIKIKTENDSFMTKKIIVK